MIGRPVKRGTRAAVRPAQYLRHTPAPLDDVQVRQYGPVVARETFALGEPPQSGQFEVDGLQPAPGARVQPVEATACAPRHAQVVITRRVPRVARDRPTAGRLPDVAGVGRQPAQLGHLAATTGTGVTRATNQGRGQFLSINSNSF